MGRVKTVNGCRKPVGTQVPEPVLAAIEIARGDKDRSSWIRDLICDELDRQGISTAPLDSLPPRIPVVKTARPGTRAKQTQTRGQRPKTGPPASKAAPPPPPPARALRAPGAPVFQDPGAEAVTGDIPPAPAATRKRCTHRGYRQIGGFCHECDHLIEPGGYWRELAGLLRSGHPACPAVR